MNQARPLPTVRFAPASGEAGLTAEALWLSEVVERTPSPPLGAPERVAFDLLILAEGRGRHTLDFETIDVDKGDVVLVPSGSAQQFVLRPRFEARLVLMRPNPDSPLVGRAPAVRRPGATTLRLLRTLHREMVDFRQSAPVEASHRVLPALAIAMFTAAIPAQAPSEPETDTLVARFEVQARLHLPSNRDVGWYAARLGCSPRTLHRACREARDRSPKQILDAWLGLQARRALLEEHLPIATVADQLGFSEPTNFTKWFRRVTGSTPRAFRTATLGSSASAAPRGRRPPRDLCDDAEPTRLH